MSNYTPEQVSAICQDFLVYHQQQEAWFGLVSFGGHLSCDNTFKHYIHTAHLLAGQQLNGQNYYSDEEIVAVSSDLALHHLF